MFRTRLVSIMVVMLTQVFGITATADAPLQEWVSLDRDVRLAGASAVCGFEVRGRFEGDAHFIVFYDESGAIIREVDTFPALKVTVYAPSTGMSYTSTKAAVLIQYYTNGAAIGSEVTAVVNGLAERIPGVDLDAGRFVYSAVVASYDPAGVPIIRFVSEISSVGPDLETTLGAARCAGVS